MTTLIIESKEDAEKLKLASQEVTKIEFEGLVVSDEIIENLSHFISNSHSLVVVDLRECLCLSYKHLETIGKAARNNLSLKVISVKKDALLGKSSTTYNFSTREGKELKILAEEYQVFLAENHKEFSKQNRLNSSPTEIPQEFLNLLKIFKRNLEKDKNILKPEYKELAETLKFRDSIGDPVEGIEYDEILSEIARVKQSIAEALYEEAASAQGGSKSDKRAASAQDGSEPDADDFEVIKEGEKEEAASAQVDPEPADDAFEFVEEGEKEEAASAQGDSQSDDDFEFTKEEEKEEEFVLVRGSNTPPSATEKRDQNKGKIEASQAAGKSVTNTHA